jgi:chromatin remodeling complex protein RSC6
VGQGLANDKEGGLSKDFIANRHTLSTALMKPMTPSAALGAVIGVKALPRIEVTRKVWDYIKKNGLQDKNAKTMINPDAKLKAVLGKDQVSMFEMTKIISGHLK